MSEPAQKPGRSKQDFVITSRERFWLRVEKSAGADACWPFSGAHAAGYGWFYLGGGRALRFNEYAHRLALFYATGEWGAVAMHHCDNRDCCNPRHLSWATHAENSQDALAKGREYIGSKNSNAVLDEETVLRARKLREEGLLLKDIAFATGCSVSLLAKVCRREIWRHI